MKPLFDLPTETATAKADCPNCSHPKAHHCKPGAFGFFIRRGRGRMLIRCQHSETFAQDERAVCTSNSCARSGCKCPGYPTKARKKKEVVA